MLRTFDSFITLVPVRSKVKTCRDPKDDFLLSLAQDGKADILVTGDQDLLILGNFGHTKIMTIKEFLVKEF
jgi:putative PIN family toxin of toxin-antitoxin system